MLGFVLFPIRAVRQTSWSAQLGIGCLSVSLGQHLRVVVRNACVLALGRGVAPGNRQADYDAPLDGRGSAMAKDWLDRLGQLHVGWYRG